MLCSPRRPLMMAVFIVLFPVSALATTATDLMLQAIRVQPTGSNSGSSVSGGTTVGLAGELHFSPAWSAQAGVTFPSSLDEGFGNSISLTLYTLTIRYHFLPNSTLSPYLGVGGYYSSSSLKTSDPVLGIEGSTSNVAAQAGVDYQFNPHWLLNLDVRYLHQLQPQQTVGNSTTGFPINIDPFVIGIGIAYRWLGSP